ncbi:MAG: hypothetical protein AB7F59_01945 [Bdellovibrionales bacterium]
MKKTLIFLLFCLSTTAFAQGQKSTAKPAAPRPAPNRSMQPPARTPVVQQAPLVQPIPPELLKTPQDGLTPFRVTVPLTIGIDVPRGKVTRNYKVTIPQGSFLLGRIESNYLIIPVKRLNGPDQEVAIDITAKDKSGKIFLQELKTTAPRRTMFIDEKRAQVIFEHQPAENNEPATQKPILPSENKVPPIMEITGTAIWELKDKNKNPVFAPRAIVSQPIPKDEKIDKESEEEFREGGVMFSSLKSYPDLPVLRADTTTKKIEAKTNETPTDNGLRLTISAIERGPLLITNPVMRLDEKNPTVEVLDETSSPPPKRSQGAPKPPSSKTEAGIATPECNDCGEKNGLQQHIASLVKPNNKLDELYVIVEKYLGQPINDCKTIGDEYTVHDRTLFNRDPADCVPKTTTQKGKDKKGNPINISVTKRPIGLHKLACDLNADPEFTALKNDMPGVVENLQAADLCSRNCSAEMGGGKCGQKHEYLKAVVASVYNRYTEAFGDSRTGRTASTWGKSQLSTSAKGLEAHPFINVILRNKAYSVWDAPGDDYKRALCPPYKVDEKFWAGGVQAKATAEQVESFNVCKRECYDAIFDSPKFLKGKESFKQKFYTSGTDWKDFHGMPPMKAAPHRALVRLAISEYKAQPKDRIIKEVLVNTKRTRKNRKTGKKEKVYVKAYEVERNISKVPTIDGKPLTVGACMEVYDDSFYTELP